MADTEMEYQCPACSYAPWTDGLSVAAGDERDEYWCQRCGAESPLDACPIPSDRHEADGLTAGGIRRALEGVPDDAVCIVTCDVPALAMGLAGITAGLSAPPGQPQRQVVMLRIFDDVVAGLVAATPQPRQDYPVALDVPEPEWESGRDPAAMEPGGRPSWVHSVPVGEGDSCG